MTDTDAEDVEATVEAFLSAADAVYEEYDQGYMDADVALARLRAEIGDLERTIEE